MARHKPHKLGSQQRTQRVLYLFIACFAVIGIVALRLSSAATSTASFEAETGILGFAATKASTASASSGQYIEFGDPGVNTGVSLPKEICGVWVLYQVSSVTELNNLRSRIEDALSLPGVVGFSVRFPWDAADMSGTTTTHPILDKAKEIADAKGKPLSIRFMAGAHTPARVWNAGAAYYMIGTQKSPLPWDGNTAQYPTTGGQVGVFLDEYEKYVVKLVNWAKSHDVRLLHLSWFGQDWAELNYGAEVRGAVSATTGQDFPDTGFTEAKWIDAHKKIIDIGAKYMSDSLAVELPMSGYGPVMTGQAQALADYIVSKAGANSYKFIVQANGWDETREFGAPSTTVENQYRQIWSKSVRRGLQMIQPDGYNWSAVFDRLTAVNAIYGEVYLPSFWQIPGPNATYNHNTPERIAQLKSEIAEFNSTVCAAL